MATSPTPRAAKPTRERKREGVIDCWDGIGLTGRRWYFNLTSGNNEIVVQSQGYRSAEARDKGIAAAKALFRTATRVDR